MVKVKSSSCLELATMQNFKFNLWQEMCKQTLDCCWILNNWYKMCVGWLVIYCFCSSLITAMSRGQFVNSKKLYISKNQISILLIFSPVSWFILLADNKTLIKDPMHLANVDQIRLACAICKINGSRSLSHLLYL